MFPPAAIKIVYMRLEFIEIHWRRCPYIACILTPSMWKITYANNYSKTFHIFVCNSNTPGLWHVECESWYVTPAETAPGPNFTTQCLNSNEYNLYRLFVNKLITNLSNTYKTIYEPRSRMCCTRPAIDTNIKITKDQQTICSTATHPAFCLYLLLTAHCYFCVFTYRLTHLALFLKSAVTQPVTMFSCFHFLSCFHS